jgi:hypothetical protein
VESGSGGGTDEFADDRTALISGTALISVGIRAVVTAFLLLSAGNAVAQTVSIQLENGAFRVTGWNAPKPPAGKDWPAVFAVYTGAGDSPALLGNYTVEAGVLVFRPRYPFAAGMKYRAVFHPPDGGASVEKIFDGPPRAVNAEAWVDGIYPSADVLPSNLLRIYINFSAAMSRGEAASRIHMLDGNGKVLPGVFLPGEELWDPAGKRLTMTLDPGRIKRGLTANMAMGPPIEQGKQYTLVIDREWHDARGVGMMEGFRKNFRGGPAERTAPDPKKWTITAPKAATADALVITFPRPMNYALLQRMLQVAGPQGNVAGTVSTGQQETQWRLAPQTPWKAGDYRLIVDTGIEDLAGNRIGQPFDVDVFEHVTQHIETKTLSLPFSVR